MTESTTFPRADPSPRPEQGFREGEVLAPLRTDLRVIAGLIRPREKVLDLGCGDGALLRYLVDTRGITGRGIELSEPGVLACVRRGLSVRQGDLDEGLRDYPDRAFDTVILSQTLPYLDNPEFIIREMLRVGGRAIISFANYGHWRCRLDLLLAGRVPTAADLPEPWFAPPRIRPLTTRDFREFCDRRGMRIRSAIYLQGERQIRLRLGRDLQTTTAIFEMA